MSGRTEDAAAHGMQGKGREFREQLSPQEVARWSLWYLEDAAYEYICTGAELDEGQMASLRNFAKGYVDASGSREDPDAVVRGVLERMGREIESIRNGGA